MYLNCINDLFSTYIVDPKFARFFTAGWTGLLGLFVILAAPQLYRSIRTGRLWQSFGFWEKPGGYQPLPEKLSQEGLIKPSSSLTKALGGARALVHGPTLLSIPKTQIDLGEGPCLLSSFNAE